MTKTIKTLALTAALLMAAPRASHAEAAIRNSYLFIITIPVIGLVLTTLGVGLFQEENQTKEEKIEGLTGAERRILRTQADHLQANDSGQDPLF